MNLESYPVIQIDEHTWRIEDQIVRFFLLEGTEKALMIDSGITTVHAKAIAETLTTKPIELLNTHGDMDHVAGNGDFDWFYMHPSEASNYYNEQGRHGRFVGVEEGDVLDLGNRPLEIIHLPGHTPGSIAVLDKQNRALFSGDPVQDGSIFMFGLQREFHAYLYSLKKLEQRQGDFDRIYPSHASCPVSPALIPQLYEGAQKICDGAMDGTPDQMHGIPILRCDVGAAVFLCEAKEP